MVKGGFQGLDITGVDLTAQSPTLPGAYATCAGADGKPIRVQTADGQVECSVKKVSTNYVLAGITGDGKILSITIGSTDGISVSESEIPDEAADEYLDLSVDISSATSSAPYITEYDGIVKINTGSSEPTSSTVTVYVKNGVTHSNSIQIACIPSGSSMSTLSACFVKKGAILYTSGSASGVYVNFYPYKPVQS